MWLELQIFGFRALWSPLFLLFLIGLALLYILITGPLRNKFGGTEKPSIKQHGYFYSGLILLYIVKGSPIDLLSHIMLSAHMLQMVFYYFLFPILIIKGIPVWIWKKVVYAPVLKPIIKLLTRPLIALLLFNGFFSLYHMPAIFDYSKSSQIAHSSISIALLIMAFIMWWAIMAPIKEMNKLSPLLKIAFLVASAAIITISCAIIIFSNTPLFTAYTSEGAWIQAMSLCVPGNVLEGISFSISGPEMFSPLSIMEDQQLAGIIMKIMQEVIYGIIIARIFFAWFSKKNMGIDPLPAEVIESH